MLMFNLAFTFCKSLVYRIGMHCFVNSYKCFPRNIFSFRHMLVTTGHQWYVSNSSTLMYFLRWPLDGTCADLETAASFCLGNHDLPKVNLGQISRFLPRTMSRSEVCSDVIGESLQKRDPYLGTCSGDTKSRHLFVVNIPIVNVLNAYCSFFSCILFFLTQGIFK